jgi:hypothetical protein
VPKYQLAREKPLPYGSEGTRGLLSQTNLAIVACTINGQIPQHTGLIIE